MKMKKSVLILLLAGLMFIGFQTDGYAKKNKQKLTKEQKRIAKIEKKEKLIVKHVGTRANWKPAVFKNIRKGMTCSQVARVFKGLNCRTSSSFKTVSVGLGTVSQLKFYFNRGRLQNATIIFSPRLLDQKVFNTALSNVVQRKWGPISNTADIRWKNGNYENVKLKFNKSHWELEVQLPSIDPGDVNLGIFNEAGLRDNLETFFGGRDNCVPAFFTRYRYHMTWQEVKQIHPDLSYNPSKSINQSYVSILNHPLVAGLRLRIDSGLLEGVEAVFHWQIPRDLFKQVSFEVMRGKYGTGLKDEKIVKDHISVYTSSKEFVYRQWKTDRWSVNMRLPKKGGVPVVAARAKNPAPRLKSVSAPSAPIGDITGDWKLTAARKGNKVAPMDDGVERKIEFTAGKEIKMKENGKIVMSNYYKVSGNGLYFTSAKGGGATKKFGTVISCKNNKLVMTIEGQSVQMIFERQ